MERNALRGVLTPAAACTERLSIEPATPADDAGIRALLRDEALGGSVRLSLEREPDASRAAGIEGEPHHGFVVRRGGAIVALGSRSVRDVWVNGAPARVGYLGLLRRRSELAGSVRLLAEGFAACDATRGGDELPYDLTSVVADNVPARRLLERGLPGLPVYRPLCRFRTLVVPVGHGAGRHDRVAPSVHRASREHLPSIAACLARNLARYQLAPRWSVADLANARACRDLAPEDFFVVERGSRVVACLALWDQRRFKQAVVRGYARPLAFLRPAFNAAAALRGTPGLPAVGTSLSLAFLSHLAADGDDPENVIALVRAARRASAESGIDHLVLGFAGGNALAAAIERSFPVRAYETIIYIVHRPRAREAVELLDGRLPHLEVATL